MTAPSPPRPRGINVIGQLSTSAGLGNTSRAFIRLLRRHGFEVAGFDVEAYAQEASAELALDLGAGMLVENVRDLPFDVNLVIASIDRLPQMWLNHVATIAGPRFRNAGLLFWELPVIPPAWIPSLQMFDVMLTCSQYVRQTFEAAIPEVPTVHAEHPLAEPSGPFDRAATRRRHAIPLEAIAFCCSFDPRSGLSRKNPLGAITAWLEAFAARPDVCLVIKSNGDPAGEHPDAQAILAAASRDPRVIWIPERLRHDEVIELFDGCDVFVSLHRSEGLGLIPMEAMALGKLVIATGYSGNVTFMSEQNSLLVPYRLIEPAFDRPFLTRRFAGPGASWADPDHAQAVRLLQRAADDPALRARLAAQARLDIAARQQTAWQGGFIDDMLRYLESSTRVPLRARLRRRILVQEMLDPTLRRKNIKHVMAKRASGERR
jgi:hypothetical protein